MALSPSIIPSHLLNFASLRKDPAFVSRRHLRFGAITLTRIGLAPTSGMYMGAEQVIVARHCGVPLRLEWRTSGGDKMFSQLIVPGAVHVKAAQEQFWQRWLLPADVFVVGFDKALFEKLSKDATGSVTDPVGELGISDPVLSQLTALLNKELLRGGLNGRLYVESLGTALAAHLLGRRYPRVSAMTREARLAPTRLRRVIDYINSHIENDLGLDEMAAIAGLATHHFAHVFKATTGTPPHRFILARRVEAARRRLETTTESIAEVAVACGFASQSHFTQVFRRSVGMTPAQYRRQL